MWKSTAAPAGPSCNRLRAFAAVPHCLAADRSPPSTASAATTHVGTGPASVVTVARDAAKCGGSPAVWRALFKSLRSSTGVKIWNNQSVLAAAC